MKPAPFDYAAPASVAEAVSLLSQGDREAKVLAGGQSLVPLLNMRFARPELLVDVSRIDELDFIREDGDAIVIGAGTTKRAVERSQLVASKHPMLHAATSLIAHPQIRNRGTIGGSMAQADPAAEYPALAVVLDAELTAVGPEGTRTIPASEFFVTYLTTALGEQDLLTQVRFPTLPEGTGWSFREVARRHGDFAIVGAAISLRIEGGACADTRIALFGVADAARRMPGAEAAVNGQPPSAALFEQVSAALDAEIEDPLSDAHASEEYRRQLARVLTRRGLAEAAERAGASL